ncbi:MAG: polyhydroxyalkanoate synthesis regulator DNA-binding domain-containing protein [Anaerolineae bacterium]
MPVIKRYPNRKLYDTEAKRYITLEGIADLIRQGEDVTVVDHASGEDLTAVTLTQIIAEQEKKRNGFLPESVLTGLVRAGGDTISTLRRTLALPLNLWRQVDEEIERRLQVLVSRGELAADEARGLRERLLAVEHQRGEPASLSEEELARLLEKQGIPSREEFQGILERLDALAGQLDEVVKNSGSSEGQ